MEETKAALLIAEQQAEQWKAQAAESIQLNTVIAELQKLNQMNRRDHSSKD